MEQLGVLTQTVASEIENGRHVIFSYKFTSKVGLPRGGNSILISFDHHLLFPYHVLLIQSCLSTIVPICWKLSYTFLLPFRVFENVCMVRWYLKMT